jgi:hypothetical protein
MARGQECNDMLSLSTPLAFIDFGYHHLSARIDAFTNEHYLLHCLARHKSAFDRKSRSVVVEELSVIQSLLARCIDSADTHRLPDR